MSGRTPILIDCDPGHDDAMAILLALASPELELLGVTTVAGNASLANTTANAIRVLDHVGRADVPVAAGAERALVRPVHVPVDVHGETGLDGPSLPPPSRAPVEQHAIDFLAAQIGGCECPVTLVATGPLTNVALFLARHPRAAEALERVVIMGGAIGEGNVTPAAEFNIWADAEAAQRVFTSGLDLTMVGLDVTHQALLTPAHGERLRAAGRAGRLVAELRDYYARHYEGERAMAGAAVHDAVAVAQVARPQLLETPPCWARVECASELSRGRTVVALRPGPGREPNARAATAIDAGGFLELLVERIASLG